MNWKLWLRGLVAAVIGGGASAASTAVGAIVVDPGHFSTNGGLHALLTLTGATFVVGSLVSLLLYLKQSPLPNDWDGVDRREP